MSATHLEKCVCICHKHPHVMHCFPCCSVCKYCKENIKSGLHEQHTAHCKEERVDIMQALFRHLDEE